jgi:predicted TIM-barrel fold metal-dependent hydrolase
MIIDCHVHINNYHNEAEEASQRNFDLLLQEMRRNRIDIALVLTSYKTVPGRPSTRIAVELTRERKDLYVVAGVSYLEMTSDYLAEVREYLQEGSVRGLKLYPGYEPFYPSDPKLEPVYKLAAEYQAPVMVHTGDTYTPKGKVKYSHPLHLDEVAVDHPDVNFILCHIGNPWIRDCMEVVYKNGNAYTDISGLVLGTFSDRFEVYMVRQLQEMLLYGVDPDNVLFGTDWPISSMEGYVKFMGELKLPVAERNKIMYQNAARLFRLDTSDSPYEKGSLWGKFKG